MSKPTIIKGPLPGEAVDRHLKRYGHLPGEDVCCAQESYDDGYQVGRAEGEKAERERIEAIFEKYVPPHKLSLGDSVWLKRLLNKAFNHDQ